jgi:hypothetical protein
MNTRMASRLSSCRAPHRTRVPGDWLLDPIVLLCAFVLGLNDHYLKAQWHNALTGKLSDFAGLVVFPCLLLAMYEWTRWTVARTRTAAPSSRVWSAGVVHATIASVLAGLAFSAVKVTQFGHQVYLSVLGRLYPSIEGVPFALGDPQNVRDPSDLMALLVLVYPIGLARRRNEKSARSRRFEDPQRN